MLIRNPRAIRAPYPAELRSILSIERAQESRRWLAAWPQIAPAATPLHDLPGLARQLGVARIGLKDESVRSPLGSFKALGAPVALVRQIQRLHPAWEPTAILAGRYAALAAVHPDDGEAGQS